MRSFFFLTTNTIHLPKSFFFLQILILELVSSKDTSFYPNQQPVSEPRTDTDMCESRSISRFLLYLSLRVINWILKSSICANHGIVLIGFARLLQQNHQQKFLSFVRQTDNFHSYVVDSVFDHSNFSCLNPISTVEYKKKIHVRDAPYKQSQTVLPCR